LALTMTNAALSDAVARALVPPESR